MYCFQWLFILHIRNGVVIGENFAIDSGLRQFDYIHSSSYLMWNLFSVNCTSFMCVCVCVCFSQKEF